MTTLRFPSVALVTRTRWSEPPRLRHQVARLLATRGHQVRFLARGGSGGLTSDGIKLFRLPELIHHQLRVAPVMTRLNAAWMKRLLPERLGQPDLAINFNYDCFALRDVLPAVPIITLLNDDFVNRARPLARSEAEAAYRLTLGISDAVLAVSNPLVRQARAVFPDAELFLPWAREPYAAPAPGRLRSAVLYWGYINDRLDWGVVDALLAAGQRIHFVGPVERTRQAAVRLSHPNAGYHGVQPLGELPDVLADCCCSILPYDLSRSHREVTLSNRAFDLLARGLPLVHAAYPEWLAAPSGIFTAATTGPEYVAAIAACRAQFDAIQPVIMRFIGEHSPDARYDQLMAVATSAAERRARPTRH